MNAAKLRNLAFSFECLGLSRDAAFEAAFHAYQQIKNRGVK